MPPAPAGLFHTAEGGGIAGGGAAFGLRCDQPHFFPVAGAFAFARPRRYGADHGPVRFSNDMGGALRRQQAKGLGVLLLQLILSSLRVAQRGGAHRRGRDVKTVVLVDALRRPCEGMFAAKVRQDTL